MRNISFDRKKPSENTERSEPEAASIVATDDCRSPVWLLVRRKNYKELELTK